MYPILNCKEIERNLWRLYVLVSYMPRNHYSETNDIFLRLQRQERVQRVKKKVRLLVKTSLMDIILTLNVTMNEL